MKIDHTPLPWKWHPKSKDQQHTGSVYSEVHEGHAYAVAMMPRYQTDERWKADAELIVKAVNQYEALVRALEEIALIENKDFGPDWEEIEEAREIANAALMEARK